MKGGKYIMTIREALEALNVLEEDASSKRSIQSNLEVMLTHMLKAVYQPEYENKSSWRASILNGYKGIMREFPVPYKGALYKKYYLRELDLEFIYRDAVLTASEETGKDINVFPKKCPWTKEQLVNTEFVSEFMNKYCPK